MSGFGSFDVFCQHGTIPVCNLFPNAEPQCTLKGVGISSHKVGDIGTVLLDIIAIVLSTLAIAFAQRKYAAVGRREIQLVLGAFLLLSLCDIFTTGRALQDVYHHHSSSTAAKTLLVFTSLQLGLSVAFFWVLFLLGITGLQFRDDGTPSVLAMIVGSAFVLFTATVYISLDTGFNLTGLFQHDAMNNKNVALYILALGLPLVFGFGFVVIHAFLVIKVLGEGKPMVYLLLAVCFSAIGQVFEFYGGRFICERTSRVIDGGFFQTLMSMMAMVCVFKLWDTITTYEWPRPNIQHITHHDFRPSRPRRPSDATLMDTYESKYDSAQSVSTCRNHSITPYESIQIEKPVVMTVDQGVAELSKYKADFVDRIEKEVRQLIRECHKGDVTAITSAGKEYRVFPGWNYTDGYTSRFTVLMQHQDSISHMPYPLPTYDGEELDLWLSKPTIDKVAQVYTNFYAIHSEVRRSVILYVLSQNPTAYMSVAREFVNALREVDGTMTEEMCDGLTHLISEQLSNHTSELRSQQLGQTQLHTGGGSSVISLFAMSLARTLGRAAAACNPISDTALDAVAKRVREVVITSVCSILVQAAASKGHAATAAHLANFAAPVLTSLIARLDTRDFTGNLADAIATNVRTIVAGEFETGNKSMLEKASRISLEQFAVKLGRTLALESSLAEKAKDAAEEMAKAHFEVGLQSFV